MKILAWISLSLITLALLLAPLVMGKPKVPPTYGYSDFFGKVLTLALLLPILGRILGWW